MANSNVRAHKRADRCAYGDSDGNSDAFPVGGGQRTACRCCRDCADRNAVAHSRHRADSDANPARHAYSGADADQYARARTDGDSKRDANARYSANNPADANADSHDKDLGEGARLYAGTYQPRTRERRLESC